MRRIILWVVALLLCGWIAYQLPWAEVWETLAATPPLALTAVFAFDLFIVLTMSGRWWFLVRGLGHPLPYLPLSGYRLAAMAISYFTPGPQFGGEPFQVWVLRARHGLSASTALASVTADKIIELLVNFSILLAGVAVLLRTALLPAESATSGLWLAGGLLLLPLLLMAAYQSGRTPLTAVLTAFSRLSWLKRWEKGLLRAGETVHAAEKELATLSREARGAVAAALGVSCVNWLLFFIEFWLVYRLLGVDLTAIELITAVTAARIAFLLPLPGGLATLEASQLLAMTVLGLPPVAGISASLLFRLRDLLINGSGLWLSGRLLNR